VNEWVDNESAECTLPPRLFNRSSEIVVTFTKFHPVTKQKRTAIDFDVWSKFAIYYGGGLHNIFLMDKFSILPLCSMYKNECRAHHWKIVH
jgi:hypothetical protein